MSTATQSRGRTGLDNRTGDEGFTLIELLVVVVILGILIAIAIPVYLNYRRGANDRAAQNDLRGTVSTLEQCFSDTTAYPAAATFTAGSTAGSNGVVCTGRTGAVSTSVTLTYFPISSTDLSGYIIGASAGSVGSGKIYCYNSVAGGKITSTTNAITGYRAAC